MIAGASSASPPGDDVDRGDQLLRRRVLEQEAAGAGPQRLVDVLVEVERGQHQHARRVAGRGEDPPGRLEPVESGIRMSIRTTSGCSSRAASTASRAVGRLADDLDVRLRLEDHPEAGAHQRLVVDDQDADGHRGRSCHAAAAPRPEAAARPRAGVELAAEERDPLAHADQAVAAAAVVALAAPVVRDLELDIVAAVADGAPSACAGPACLSTFVSASCTIR